MLKKIIREIKYWSQIFCLPFYLLSFLMPRDEKIWVVGSTFGRRFADNPKFFYLYLSQYQKKNVRVIWISKNKNVIKLLNNHALEGYYLYTLKGIWYALRAKVFLYDNYTKDICFTLSGGAIHINLWHGVPLKKIQKDNKLDRVRNPKTYYERLRWGLRRMTDEKPEDYILATSEFLSPIFSSAFDTKNVIVCNYPRNDFIMSNCIENLMTPQEEAFHRYLRKKARTNKIILYMPTFRDSEVKFFNVVCVKKFKLFLEQKKMIFCIKLHPKSKLYDEFMRIKSNNIILIDPEMDPYALLEIADKLVTDYSSIYFDFLLLKKPIIFFAYDLAEYLEDSRDIYFEYEEFTPGVKVSNQNELENALIQDGSVSELASTLMKRVFEDTEELGSQQLYQKIIDIIKINNKLNHLKKEKAKACI